MAVRVYGVPYVALLLWSRSAATACKGPFGNEGQAAHMWCRGLPGQQLHRQTHTSVLGILLAACIPFTPFLQAGWPSFAMM